ncbi:polysaccharide deacetylase family protein [Lacipirellula sp.]|uniref:polysaccharide deacetylase family protein n=1 Tax=Lacipirellula sp. TaxID=2691419 RepID=UPI003D0EE535
MKLCYLATLVAATLAIDAAATVGAEPLAAPAFAKDTVRDSEGGVIRGDVKAKRLSLIFTGDEFGESAEPILETLRERGVSGGFFLTGNFVRDKRLRPLVARMVEEGHYMGPHSDSHPLYAPWGDRQRSLVTADFFKDDLQKNIDGLREAGALAAGTPVLFVPPYEWYNAEHAAWSGEMGVGLINFTPGSGSNRDYAREGDRVFVPSQKILDDILAYEQKNPHGLNGFVLLLHLGSGRRDPFHPQLGTLCDKLSRRGYEFVRVDELLLAPAAR